jgi:hypothetical protein
MLSDAKSPMIAAVSQYKIGLFALLNVPSLDGISPDRNPQRSSPTNTIDSAAKVMRSLNGCPLR